MFRSGDFWIGVVAGVAVVFLYHHFVAPVPGAKTGG
jgi:thymidylate synthase